ncbi:MAG: arylamine N-acetyltransferase [Gemmatimonadaceae bacterium]|nr:arylamine N-acetyltransferase [Gemmatimonadaceae bacterium]
MAVLDKERVGAYMARVRYDGPLTPTGETLRALHRAHLTAIPYENLDIHLDRPLTLDRQATFAKLVDGKRGGWCFEMNGTFGWVLESIGFEVRYVAGAVKRADRGARALDSHLVLIVTVDRPYIVDVGFGDGFFEPLPLEPGRYRQQSLEFGVSRDGEWWRVHNHEYGGADSYDFTLERRSINSFAARCHELQTAVDSSFVRSTVCGRYERDGLVVLRGAVLREVKRGVLATRVIADADDYVGVLAERFDLTPAGIATLWPTVHARHIAWVAAQGCRP